MSEYLFSMDEFLKIIPALLIIAGLAIATNFICNKCNDRERRGEP